MNLTIELGEFEKPSILLSLSLIVSICGMMIMVCLCPGQ